MTGPMKNVEVKHLLRRELKAVAKLAPWILASLLLAALLWRADLAAMPGLFQSPPGEGTPAEETPASVETEVPLPVDTPLPTDTPMPTDTLEPTATSTSTSTPMPSDTPAPAPTSDERQRYADENSRFKFEWGTLFDAVALGASYVWLCCGGLLLVLIPLFFIVLWTASKRRKKQEE